ncbi:MAG: type II toxin-antitoxin system VapC family toxin [Acetobacteraceae bacterium]
MLNFLKEFRAPGMRLTVLTDAARGAVPRYGKGRHPAGFNLGDCMPHMPAETRGLPLLCKGEATPNLP